MQPCARSDLIRVLPLGVAFNWAGKRRLIWDGRYVNAYLREEDFRIEMLQREGRTLFGDARYGGTVDVLAAYHHVHMRPDATLYLGFEWQGQFYPLFGAAIRPGHGPADFYGGRGSHRPFSALRGGSGLPLFRVNFGRSDFRRHHGPGGRGSDGAQHPLAVRLARPPDQVRRVQRAYFLIRGTGYLDGPGGEVVFRPCQQALVLAQLGMGRGRGVRLGPGPRRGPPQGSHHFLVGGDWQRDPSVHPGDGPCHRTTAPGDFVFAAGSTPVAERVGRALTRLSGGDPLVAVCRVNGQTIRNIGAGAVISVEGPEAAASSVVRALLRTAPPGMSHYELVERARSGIESMTARAGR